MTKEHVLFIILEISSQKFKKKILLLFLFIIIVFENFNVIKLIYKHNINNKYIISREKKKLLLFLSRRLEKKLTKIEAIFLNGPSRFGNLMVLLNKAIFYCEILKCKRMILNKNIYWFITKNTIDTENNMLIELGDIKDFKKNKDILIDNTNNYFWYYGYYQPQYRINIIKDQILQNLPKIITNPNDLKIYNKGNSLFEAKKNESKSLLLNKKYILLKTGFTLIIFLQILFFLYYIRFGKILLTNIFLLKENQESIFKNSNITYHFLVEGDMFSENMKKKYEIQQDLFCQNQILFNNAILEAKIKTVKIDFENIYFNMLVYKENDIVSNQISEKGFWEARETRNFLFSLSYYSQKKNISKNHIYILDIGANIGWFSLFFGKKGYKIISFEPSFSNYYILLKNFCMNKEINITIINSGLDNVTKNSSLYHPLYNIGNAYTYDAAKKLNLKNYIKEDIKFSKLSDYIPYLSNKNLALIKLDIEGCEGKALEGGIDLIIKYHIPFIFMEWTPDLMKVKGSDPKLFLEMLENNGYKISIKDFLSKQFSSMEQLLKEKEINIYIIYTKFLE